LKEPVKKPALPVDVTLPDDGQAGTWTSVQRFEALMQTHGLEGEALNSWCREHGVFAHQLTEWRQDFCSTPRDIKDSRNELRDLQNRHQQLQRELRRKEKALAEAAALLVLQKKFRALLEDEDK
jgi:transposase-like protein